MLSPVKHQNSSPTVDDTLILGNLLQPDEQVHTFLQNSAGYFSLSDSPTVSVRCHTPTQPELLVDQPDLI